MRLILTLAPARFYQVSHVRVVCVVHKFNKCFTAVSVKSELDLRANQKIIEYKKNEMNKTKTATFDKGGNIVSEKEKLMM